MPHMSCRIRHAAEYVYITTCTSENRLYLKRDRAAGCEKLSSTTATDMASRAICLLLVMFCCQGESCNLSLATMEITR